MSEVGSPTSDPPPIQGGAAPTTGQVSWTVRVVGILLSILSFVLSVVWTVVYWREYARLNVLYTAVTRGVSLILRTFSSAFGFLYRSLRRFARLVRLLYGSARDFASAAFKRLFRFLRLTFQRIRVVMYGYLGFIVLQLSPMLVTLFGTIRTVETAIRVKIDTLKIQIQFDIAMLFVRLIVRGVRALIDIAVPFFQNLVSLLTDALVEGWQFLMEQLTSTVQDLTNLWATLVDGTLAVFTTFTQTMAEFFEAVFEPFKFFYCAPCVACNEIPAGVFRDACFDSIASSRDCNVC